MASRAANDFFGFFINIKIIDIQMVNIFIDETAALNRADELDALLLCELDIVIAGIMSIYKQFIGHKVV